MSHVVRQVLYEMPNTDANENVLWMKARRLIATTGYRTAYEEFSVYVSPQEMDALTQWYTQCNKHFGFGWLPKLEGHLCAGLSLDAARKKIDEERGC